MKYSGIMYVYKGKNITCRVKKHKIISAQAITPCISGKIVPINACYCTQCKKLFISEKEYLHYVKEYGVLLIRMRHIDTAYSDEFIGKFADESPLKMCGYTVNSTNGYTTAYRQSILKGIMDNDVMSKDDIINYLNSFISLRSSDSRM